LDERLIYLTVSTGSFTYAIVAASYICAQKKSVKKTDFLIFLSDVAKRFYFLETGAFNF
jgi:hypothetical protein